MKVDSELLIEDEVRSFLLSGLSLALQEGVTGGAVPILSMTEALYIDGDFIDEAVVSFGFGLPDEQGAVAEISIEDRVFFLDAKMVSHLPAVLFFKRIKSGQRFLKLRGS
jgi:hypothetical protein